MDATAQAIFRFLSLFSAEWIVQTILLPLEKFYGITAEISIFGIFPLVTRGEID